jgi:hypothetical protein
MTSQTRTARRQLLLDRWAERLTTAGDPHATDHARQLLADMDDLGFDLPATLDDAPPARPAHIASEEVRSAALAQIRATLATRNT